MVGLDDDELTPSPSDFQALKQLPREQVQVATKFGIRRGADGVRAVCGRPEYVRACCEASLGRLGVDYIDLYYQHRVDTTIPIEDTVSCSTSPPFLISFFSSLPFLTHTL